MKQLRSILALLLCAVMLCACNENKQPDDTTTSPVVSGAAEVMYSVSIVDPTGNAVTSGVIVNFMNGTETAAMQSLNAQGIAEKLMPAGTYTVLLGFTDPSVSYYYDGALTVSADQPTAQVVLSKEAEKEENSYSLYDPDTGEEYAYTEYFYRAGTGCTHIPLTQGEMVYVYFVPEQSGVYRFSVIGGTAPMGYYGSPYFIQSASLAEPDETGAFNINVSNGMIGTGGTGTSTLVLGIDSGDATDCIISIERIADPEVSIEDYPWDIYQKTVDIGAFTMSDSVQLKEFDLTAENYTLVLNEYDGFYHLDTADGPLVYAKLGVASAYLDSIQKVLESSGISRYFFDDNGSFVNKVSYSECLLEYISCMDENTGLYPLTEDLAYIFKQRGEYVGWWDPAGHNYLFVDDNGSPIPGINTDIAWLFLCCYSDGNETIVDPDPTPSDPTTEPSVPETEPPTQPSTEPEKEPTQPSTEPETEPTEPPHTHDYQKTVVQPGCLEQGYTRYTCVCGDSYDADYTKATGHSWGEWTVTKEPTETAMGEKKRECAGCGETETGTIPVVVPEHTHAYQSAVTKAATCTQTGVLTYSCTCGASYTETIEKAEHTYEDKVTAPSCTAAGFTSHTCAVCGDHYKDQYTDKVKHNYTGVVTKPTCTNEGYTTYTCTVCGDHYKDQYTDKKEHNYVSKVTAATCTSDGATIYTCSICADTYQESIPKSGHSYQANVTAPTCTEKGYTTYTCTVCSDSYTGDEKASAGHDWGEWEETTAYTESEPGVKTQTCSLCGIEQSKTELYYFHVDETMSFDAEVKAGTCVRFDLYRMFDMIITIESEDAYIIYDNQVVKPQSGILTFTLVYGANNVTSPCEIAIGNAGESDATFAVKFSLIPGAQNNPVNLELGSFTTKTREGDYQGYYYTYTADADGLLTVQFDSIDIDKDCEISLYNTNTGRFEVQTNSSVSVNVNAGDEVQIHIVVVDDEQVFPAATVVATAILE